MASVYSIAYLTVPDRKTADALAEGIVKRRLAACVNIVPGVSSVFWWDDKLDRSEELLLVAKTRTALVADLTEYVRRNHPYSLPEVITVDIQEGNQSYLDWVGANTVFGKPGSREDLDLGELKEP
ncbi:MAG: divalent-cation tolerance protein CutA [Elusimicrobiota bacterium]